MHISRLKKVSFISLASLSGFMATGCGLVTDDLDPCPEAFSIRFVYDYNLKWADAFAHEVSSVNVWAFDSEGKPVWSGSASGPELSTGDFYLTTDLKDGRYEFIAWCGLKDNGSFDLATYTPASKQELEVAMKTIQDDGATVSKVRLPGLYHGLETDVQYTIDPYNPTLKSATVKLMKDTKDIRVMLQHLDGSEIDNRDFSVTITDENAEYAWNNDLLPSPFVTYKPWNTKYGVVTAPDNNETRDITTVASLLFELSTGRLMKDANAVLTVHRNWDDKDIIRIPLIDYLLLVKGNYGDITDQEYLDRQDDYSMVFFIDANSNWYIAAGIYINGWAVVPPQSSTM